MTRKFARSWSFCLTTGIDTWRMLSPTQSATPAEARVFHGTRNQEIEIATWQCA